MTKQKLIGSSIALAVVVGCVFGMAIDNLAIGIGIGMLFGVAYAIPLSVAIGRNKKK
ncbi:MAG TPA: hypothetical protein VLG09_01450 [Candidatus Saccharimonadales bacterium]|nr:hypothetical protein [Candidatus Saccharimonadales bacterium]